MIGQVFNVLGRDNLGGPSIFYQTNVHLGVPDPAAGGVTVHFAYLEGPAGVKIELVQR